MIYYITLLTAPLVILSLSENEGMKVYFSFIFHENCQRTVKNYTKITCYVHVTFIDTKLCLHLSTMKHTNYAKKLLVVYDKLNLCNLRHSAEMSKLRLILTL